VIPRNGLTVHPLGLLIRPELARLKDEVLGSQIDPNRAVIEWINAKAQPNDEILVNYEDIPFMFYTQNPIRGGIPCFRVEDRGATPRFLIIRRSVSFLHWPVFIREINRYKWERIPLTAPDIPFGNNPEPGTQIGWLLPHDGQAGPDLILAENVDYASKVKN
jgi:hypothetical protein